MPGSLFVALGDLRGQGPGWDPGDERVGGSCLHLHFNILFMGFF